MVKLKLLKRRKRLPHGSFVARGTIYDYTERRPLGRRITRTEHPPIPWLRPGGATEGSSFAEKLRNPGVPVFDRHAREAQLGGYLHTGRSAGRDLPLESEAGPTYDADAELRGYLDRGGGTS